GAITIHEKFWIPEGQFLRSEDVVQPPDLIGVAILGSDASHLHLKYLSEFQEIFEAAFRVREDMMHGLRQGAEHRVEPGLGHARPLAVPDLDQAPPLELLHGLAHRGAPCLILLHELALRRKHVPRQPDSRQNLKEEALFYLVGELLSTDRFS